MTARRPSLVGCAILTLAAVGAVAIVNAALDAAGKAGSEAGDRVFAERAAAEAAAKHSAATAASAAPRANVVAEASGTLPVRTADAPPRPHSSSAPTEASTAEPIGQASCEVRFPGDDVDEMPFFPTEAGDDAFMDLVARGHMTNAELALLMAKNGGFLVSRGTKVAPQGGGVLSTQVRILEGPHIGETVWTPREWVKCR